MAGTKWTEARRKKFQATYARKREERYNGNIGNKSTRNSKSSTERIAEHFDITAAYAFGRIQAELATIAQGAHLPEQEFAARVSKLILGASRGKLLGA